MRAKIIEKNYNTNHHVTFYFMDITDFFMTQIISSQKDFIPPSHLNSIPTKSIPPYYRDCGRQDCWD